MSGHPIFWDDQDASGRIKYLILIGATLSAALYETVNFNNTTAQIMFFFLYMHTNLTLNIVIKKHLITIPQPLKKTVQHFIHFYLV